MDRAFGSKGQAILAPDGRTIEVRGLPAYFTVELPDGSVVGVPVALIAWDRATYYARDYDGNVERSLAEDTVPLFAQDRYAIQDWAENNMNWAEVAEYQVLIKAPALDFQEAWLNGPKGFSDGLE